jgi:hypothetical protein
MLEFPNLDVQTHRSPQNLNEQATQATLQVGHWRADFTSCWENSVMAQVEHTNMSVEVDKSNFPEL